MIRRTLLALLFCLAAPVAAFAQDPAPAPAVRVAIQTDIGTILAETDPRAPVTSANFLRYVDEGRFDG
ncbi:MAG TPA: peptidylprolyl isomerase, partial [Brevundimonas sp.]